MKTLKQILSEYGFQYLYYDSTLGGTKIYFKCPCGNIETAYSPSNEFREDWLNISLKRHLEQLEGRYDYSDKITTDKI